MKRILKLTESDLVIIVRKLINENLFKSIIQKSFEPELDTSQGMF